MENHIKELLKKYLSGTCTEEELVIVNEWYDSIDSPEDAIVPNPYELARIKESMKNNIFFQAKIEKRGTGNNKLISIWLKIAASLLLFIFFTGLFIILFPFKKQFVTKNGETKTIILPDNSKVILNAASKLSYSANWEEGLREVYLEGEGFFEVVKNKKRPFIVHADKIDIRVLGTSFNVKSYKDEEKIETTLVSGAIIINRPDNVNNTPLALKPNEGAIYNKYNKTIQKIDKATVDVETSWKEGKLIFYKENFLGVMKQLERRFGKKIKYDTKNEDCLFTGKFENETLVEILEVIKKTSYINYTIKSDRILITGGFCN